VAAARGCGERVRARRGARPGPFIRVAATAAKAQNADRPPIVLREDVMPKLIAAAIAAFVLVAPGTASAEIGCAPYCDFTHYYGPQDFTYVRPGLFVYPRCGPSGECSPYLVSSGQRWRGRITVRSLTRPLRPRP
jgi:hypothetical protein